MSSTFLSPPSAVRAPSGDGAGGLREWVPGLALVGLGLGAAFLLAEAEGKVLVGGIGLLMGVGAALIAGYRAFGLVWALVVARSSLDWFVAADSAGGKTPVTGLQPAIVAGATVLVAAVAWLAVQAAAGTLRRPSATGLTLIALSVVCMITSLGADDPVLSLTTSLRVLDGALLFLMVEQLLLRDPRRMRLLLVGLGLSLVLPAIVSSVQFGNRPPGQAFVTSTFVHQNTMAAWLTLLIPPFACLIRYTKGLARAGCIAAASLATLLLLLTYCRGAWIGVVVALAIVALVQERRLLVVGALAVGAVWVFVPSVQERFSDLGEQRVEGQGDPNSFAFRQRYWHEILADNVDGVPLIQNITGMGLGMVEVTMEEGLEPHNVWVQVLAETGVAGTGALALVVAVTTVSFARGIRRLPPGAHRAIALGAAAASANMLVQSLSQNLLTEAVTWTYFGTVLALGSAAMHLGARPPQPRATPPFALDGERVVAASA